MFDDLPGELTTGQRFVCWQYQEREGKKTKVPVSPKGGMAKVNTPSTWGTFQEAVTHCEKQGLSGIGIVLSKNGGPSLVGIDLDHCIDDADNLTPEAKEIVETLNSYSEITPSGRGLRVFVKGELPDGARRKGPIEIYDDLRYLTLTGNHLEETPKTVEARQDELIRVWRKYVSPELVKEKSPVSGKDMPDDDLIQKAMSAANGATFHQLWAGDFSGYPSQSEADLSLCSMLAFWTRNDAGRIDDLFRQSGLYRPKWDKVHVQGRTYGEETIRKAIAGTTEVYEGRRERQAPVAARENKPLKEPVNILSQLFRWDDIAEMDVSTEWLLEKLLPKGAISLVFCPGGGGKTWLLMQLAKAIATGEPFGDLQTLQAPVYFIDFENPLSVVKERREKIGPAPGFWYWHLACPTGPRKLDEEAWTDYKTLPPGLLIFDTLRASHNGDENSSKDMALVLSRLKELREAGFTIVVLHHTPKGNDGTYKGSTAILDLADHVLSLERQGKTEDEEFDPDSIFKFGCRIKTRFEPHSVFLSFDPAHGFTTKDDPDDETMKIMRDILSKEGPLKQKEFRKTLEEKLEMKKSRIFKLLRKGTGTLWNVERGDKNSMLYSSIPVFPLTKVAENWKTESGDFMGNGKHNDVNNTKTFDAVGFSSFPEGDGKTEKTEDMFERAVMYYREQGLSEQEARFLAREEV